VDKKAIKYVGILAGVMLIVLLGACNWATTRAGKLRQESETIELGGAESVAVDIRMGAGELTIKGGTQALVEADFTYNVAEWGPTIDYAVVSGERGELVIEQPAAENVRLDSYRYEWDLTLNDQVPMDLGIALGAGKSTIDVSELSLTDFDLEMGVGDVEVDLTGARERDLAVSIRGGVGAATVLLPSNVGVRAEVRGGLGDLTTSGLTREGGAYVNDAYGTSDTTITLDVEGGVGEIELRVIE
jgi:hypothetical protein